MPDHRTVFSVGNLGGEPITVLMAFDNEWAPYAATTIASTCVHAVSPVQIVVLTTNLSSKNAERFCSLISSSIHALKIIRIDPDMTKKFGSLGWWSNAAYLRLAAAEIVDTEKIIYLDSDIIVKCPLDELFSLDLRSAAVAGVVDIPSRLLQMSPRLNWLNLPKSDHYINTGVLLMDLSRLRSQGFFDAAINWYGRNHGSVRLADQCVLNSVLINQKAYLHPRWNIRQLSLPTQDFASMLCSNLSAIFHFNVATKPWTEGADTAVYQEWLRYFRKTTYVKEDCDRSIRNPDPSFLKHINEIEKAFREAGIDPKASLRKHTSVR